MKVTVAANGTLEIRERLADHHHSLVTRVRFLPTDVVHPFGAREHVPHPTGHSVQVGESEHILLTPPFLEYINNSCDPNVVFDTDTRLVTAVRVIEPGEEIMFFYPSTEWRLASPFECQCGSTRCLGRIAGASTLDPVVLQSYQLAPHIIRLANVSRRAETSATT
jgi:hypothetical protein